MVTLNVQMNAHSFQFDNRTIIHGWSIGIFSGGNHANTLGIVFDRPAVNSTLGVPQVWMYVFSLFRNLEKLSLVIM